MQQHTVIFIGPQGSGKGTQAALLHEYLEGMSPDVPPVLVQTGKGFRDFMEGDGYTERKVKEQLERGEKMNEFLAVWLWTKEFIAHLNGNEHLLIDGFPRTVLEAQVLDGALEFYRPNPVHVVYFHLDDAVARERLLARGRFDDTEENIAERLSWYRKTTLPIIEFMQKNARYTVVDIDASESIEAVHQKITKQFS